MELEKFIEKDIIEFLDIEISKEQKEDFPGLTRSEEVDAFSLTRDYSKEVRVELASSNLGMSAKIFNQLKEEYEKFPAGSSEQLKAYEVMLEVRSQIINFLHHSSLYPDPENSLKQAGVILPPPPVSGEEKPKEEPAEKKEEKTPDYDRDQIMRGIEEKLNKIQLSIENKDKEAAVSLYEELKKSFNQIPDDLAKEKQRIFDHITTVYYQIKELSEGSETAKNLINPTDPTASDFPEMPEAQQDVGFESIPAMPGIPTPSETVPQTEQEIEAQIREIDEGTLDAIEEKVEESEYEQEQFEQEEEQVFSNSLEGAVEELQSKESVEEEPEVPIPQPTTIERKPPEFSLTEKQVAEIEERVEETEVVEEEKEELEVLEEKPEDPKGYTTEEVLASLEDVKQLVKKKDPKKAFSKYKNTKKLFADINAPIETREELFKDILAVYKSIRELERNMVNRKQRPKPKSIIEEREEPDLMEKINKVKIKTYKYLDKNEIKSSIIEYNRLKELFQKLPDDDSKERLHHELMDLHDRIEEVKNIPVGGVLRKKIKNVNLLIEHDKMQEAQQALLDLERESIGSNEEDLNNIILSLKSKVKVKNTKVEN